MNTTNVKDQIREALAMEWPAFQARHPNLAAVLDQELLIDQATAQLADDPEYKKAMTEAQAIGMTAQTAVQIARGFIQDWIAQLI
jgi:hypothetical protein